MYIERVPNRNSRPAILLREGRREGGKIRKRTLANLTDWPAEQIEALRWVLKNEAMVPAAEAFTIERSLPHGHVEAVLAMMQRLGVAELIAPRPSRQRSLVLAMIAERLIHPGSKLATTRSWHQTTLAASFGVEEADEDELYEAMDWLVQRQSRVEKKLAARHLDSGAEVLYDLSSSYYEGHCCPLAQFGHSRDGKRGKPIIAYGVMTDAEGRPISVQVYPGDTGDPSTVSDQLEKLRNDFGLERVVLIGDRGMLTQAQLDGLKAYPGIGWISALRTEKIRQLSERDGLQLSLFDERNLAEIHCEAFPDERLIACYNPLLADERRRKRAALLEATEQRLEKLQREVARRTKQPLTAAEIGRKAGKLIHHYKMAKHFELEIADGQFRYSRNQASIEREQALDGIYVIRTSESAEQLCAEDAVRRYKGLAQVERAFRTFKGVDVRVRPIYHRAAERVRAHILLCLLVYYVEWHLRGAWASLLYADETLAHDRLERDPVAPARNSDSARRKKATHRSAHAWPVHSFSSLMDELGTRCRHTCRLASHGDAPPIEQDTEPTALQARALELIRMFPVART